MSVSTYVFEGYVACDLLLLSVFRGKLLAPWMGLSLLLQLKTLTALSVGLCAGERPVTYWSQSPGQASPFTNFLCLMQTPRRCHGSPLPRGPSHLVTVHIWSWWLTQDCSECKSQHQLPWKTFPGLEAYWMEGGSS